MLAALRNFVRREVRGRQWAGEYPVVLPHVRLAGDTIYFPDGGSRYATAAERGALALCDGTRTVGEVSAQAKVRKSVIVGCHDDDLLALWHSPVSAEGASGRPARIVVSPHLDDAALSVGGLLIQASRQGGPDQGTLILDVFSRSAWWRLARKPGDAEAVQSARQEEEMAVAHLLGAQLHLLNLPEAMLRGRTLEQAFHSGADGRDAEAIAAIREAVGQLAANVPGATWLLPLAVGNHLDHRLARDTALEAFRSAGVLPGQIQFYEELPYAGEQGGAGDFSTRVPGMKLRARLIDVAAEMRWKLELNRVYWTQFTWSRIEPLADYAYRLGGQTPVERLWISE